MRELKQGNPNALELAESSSEGSGRPFRLWNDQWYRWDGRAYGKISTAETKKQILTFLLENGHGQVRRALLNEVLDMMKLTALVEGTTIPCWLCGNRSHPANKIVAAKNGLLYLPGVLRGHASLLPHTPSFFTLGALDYDYQPRARCPQWERFVSDIFADDVESVRTAQEWLGYLLLPDTRQQKLLMMVGPKAPQRDTGKRYTVHFEFCQS